MNFTNQAQVTYNGRTSLSNVTQGRFVDALTATKTAVNDSYGVNDEITYIVSLVNTGSSELTGLTVTDNLGAYSFTPEGATGPITLYPLEYAEGSIHYFVNGVLRPEPDVTSEDGLVIEGIRVPAGGNAILVYAASVTNYAPLETDGTIENTVTVTGYGVSNEVTATETISTNDEPELRIIKAMDPTVVTDNGTLTYTFTLLNYGNTATVVTDEVIVSDTFNPVLTDITVYVDGTATTAYTYSEATGEFATNAGAVTVPAATITTDPVTGAVTYTPGEATVTVVGTVNV